MNECYKRIVNCDVCEFCINIFGFYKCLCKIGFERNEKIGKCDGNL